MPIKPPGKIQNKPNSPERELARRTRRGFLAMGMGAVGVAAGWEWLNAGQRDLDDIPPRLRSVLNFNEKVVRGSIYGNNHLVKTYPASMVGKIKVNGDIGIDDDDFDADSWNLQVVSLDPHQPAMKLGLDDIKRLPRREEIIDFKCVEGWSTVTQFAGARFSDFAAKFAPSSAKAETVGMRTPDEEYYVGLDMPSALHPQTLLAWEMNGEALEDEHGAPLRLVMPVKYGIKSIKRIGWITFGKSRPDDYWAERGYDWYAGL